MAARRPFWKWSCWKSIGSCLWPPSTCIWNLKLKFRSKLDLCSGNHVFYRQTYGRTDGRTRWIQYTPPSTSLGGGIIMPWKMLSASLWWRHNGRDCVWNHQPHSCLLNRLFGRRSKLTSKFRVTGLCVGNSPVTGEFPHTWPVTRKMFPFDDVIMITGPLCEEFICTDEFPLQHLSKFM